MKANNIIMAQEVRAMVFGAIAPIIMVAIAAALFIPAAKEAIKETPKKEKKGK